jgi:hypothetical protein
LDKTVKFNIRKTERVTGNLLLTSISKAASCFSWQYRKYIESNSLALFFQFYTVDSTKLKFMKDNSMYASEPVYTEGMLSTYNIQ